MLIVLILSLVFQAVASFPPSATAPARELLAHTQVLLLNKTPRGLERLRGGTSQAVTVVGSPDTVSLCRVALSGQAILTSFGPVSSEILKAVL